ENSNLTTNNIRTIEPGIDNEIWIGTEADGLFLLDINNKKIENIEALQNGIKSLYFNNPILWIGTNGEGLKSFNIDNGQISSYSTRNGLPNNVIYGILPDNKRDLWVSSNKGISKLRIENDSVSKIENYSNYDGLQAFEFNTGAYFKDSNGILYFGGLEGLNFFDPDHLQTNTIPPKTVISKFSVFNEKRKLTEGQTLEHDETTVTFTFSSLHFSQPERNQYKYKLMNNDAFWIDAG